MTRAKDPAGPATPVEKATKQVQLLTLIQRQNGATAPEIIEATGWLPHTIRAAVTALRKRGHDIYNERVDGVGRYRVVDGPDA
ncbi:MAG: DUF3489 domain-containing protein [Sphingobium sp.]|uniref:DUF3489 domain-containing protein n=1 Tax=Sphingobium sp. TaxID=1912891 RepID=UPI0029B5E5BC|nr:DUF3489 domain-containing protein [Sphingobium sp.]MDX3911591.1 DUF3489 domain-containing protein [Sphingobium sp.]